MGGYEVQELVMTKEAIVGNRSFAVVLESEVGAMLADPDYTPLRMTQTGFPELTLFTTEERDGNLIIHFQDEEFDIGQSVIVGDPNLPFLEEADQFKSVETALKQRALPYRVSKRSSSKRWAEDCGDGVATWLSERLGQKVRLVKAVKHPESPKHHFTWYTDLHAVMQASLSQLAEDADADVDELTFRYNALLEDTGEAFDEEQWTEAILDGTEALVRLCERCKYIGIERATATVGYHAQVLREVSQQHGMNFGVYITPKEDGTIVLRVGDEIRVVKAA